MSSPLQFFRRLSTLFRAWANALVGRIEDPSRMLDVALSDMEENLEAAATEVGRMAAEKRRLERKLEAHQKEAQSWEQKAMIAVQRGDDGLAKRCLAQKAAADRQAELIAPSLAQQNDAVAAMKADVLAMRARVEAARSKKLILETRHAGAEAQKVVLTSMETLDARDASGVLGKLEQRVIAVEAEASAQVELEAQAFERDALRAELEALDPAKAQAEDALEALRAKLGVEQAAASDVMAQTEGEALARELEHESEQEERSLFLVEQPAV